MFPDDLAVAAPPAPDLATEQSVPEAVAPVNPLQPAPPDLAAPKPTAPPHDWPTLEATPAYQSATPDQRQTVIHAYADHVRDYGLSLPGADPAAINAATDTFREHQVNSITLASNPEGSPEYQAAMQRELTPGLTTAQTARVAEAEAKSRTVSGAYAEGGIGGVLVENPPLLSSKFVQAGLEGAVPGLQSVNDFLPGTAGKITRGATEGVADLASGFSTPANLAFLGTAGAGKVVQRLVALGFSADMLSHVPEQWNAFTAATDPQEKAKQAVGLVGTVLMGVAAGAHGVRGEPLVIPDHVADASTESLRTTVADPGAARSDPSLHSAAVEELTRRQRVATVPDSALQIAATDKVLGADPAVKAELDRRNLSPLNAEHVVAAQGASDGALETTIRDPNATGQTEAGAELAHRAASRAQGASNHALQIAGGDQAWQSEYPTLHAAVLNELHKRDLAPVDATEVAQSKARIEAAQAVGDKAREAGLPAAAAVADQQVATERAAIKAKADEVPSRSQEPPSSRSREQVPNREQPPEAPSGETAQLNAHTAQPAPITAEAIKPEAQPLEPTTNLGVNSSKLVVEPYRVNVNTAEHKNVVHTVDATSEADAVAKAKAFPGVTFVHEDTARIEPKNVTSELLNELDKASARGDQIAVHTLKRVIETRPGAERDAAVEARLNRSGAKVPIEPLQDTSPTKGNTPDATPVKASVPAAGAGEPAPVSPAPQSGWRPEINGWSARVGAYLRGDRKLADVMELAKNSPENAVWHLRNSARIAADETTAGYDQTKAGRLSKLADKIDDKLRSVASVSPAPIAERVSKPAIAERTSNVRKPATMKASEINKELGALDKRSSVVTDKMIAADRGNETPTDTFKKNDPLAQETKAIFERRSQLRNEIETRYGPNAPSRLPTRKGFGPREQPESEVTTDGSQTRKSNDQVQEGQQTSKKQNADERQNAEVLGPEAKATVQSPAQAGKPVVSELATQAQSHFDRLTAVAAQKGAPDPEQVASRAITKIVNDKPAFKDDNHLGGILTRKLNQLLVDDHRAAVAEKRGGTPEIDEQGNPVLDKRGNPVMKPAPTFSLQEQIGEKGSPADTIAAPKQSNERIEGAAATVNDHFNKAIADFSSGHPGVEPVDADHATRLVLDKLTEEMAGTSYGFAEGEPSVAAKRLAADPKFEQQVRDKVLTKVGDAIRKESDIEDKVFGFGPGAAAKGEPIKGESRTIGARHESLNDRAKAMGFPEIARGEGANAAEMNDKGQQLYDSLTPEQRQQEVGKIGAKDPEHITADEYWILRAHQRELASDADYAHQLARKEGTPENVAAAQKAEQALNNFSRDVLKPYGTAWHAKGVSLQGEVDIDYGNFIQTKQRFQEAQGTPPTPDQVKQIEVLTDKVKTGQAGVETSKQGVVKAGDDSFGDGQKPAAPTEKSGNALDQVAYEILKANPDFNEKQLSDALAERVKDMMPNLTPDQVEELVSNYGKSRPLSTDPIRNKLIDIKGQWREQAKQRDLSELKNPRQTGITREPPSAELRDEIKRTNEAKRTAERTAERTAKEKGIELEGFDHEKRLSGVLDAAKTRANHSIEDLQREIDTRERAVKNKTGAPTDPELDALKEKLAAIKEQHKQVFGEVDLNTLRDQFSNRVGDKFTPEESKSVWDQARNRIADLKTGEDFSKVIGGLSRDLGLTTDQVMSALASKSKVKAALDEAWFKQSRTNKLRAQVDAYVRTANDTRLMKIIKGVPDFLFGAKIGWGLHNLAIPVTHGNALILRPQNWGTYIRYWGENARAGFGKKGEILTEQTRQLATSDPLYAKQVRSGLAVSMDKVTDSEQNYVQSLGSKLGINSESAFVKLKELRQKLWNNEYAKLTDEQKNDPEVLKELSSYANVLTNGDVSAFSKNKAVRVLLFAAQKVAAEVKGTVVRPAQAIGTGAKMLASKAGAWTEPTQAEMWRAKKTFQNSAIQTATLVSLLAANQAINTMLGSKDKINFLNPNDSDWLYFKVAGHKFSPMPGTLAALRLVSRLGMAMVPSKEKGVKARALTSSLTGYVEGKTSPAIQPVVELGITKHTFGGDVVPKAFAPNEKPGKGHRRLSMLEYGGEKLAMIPVAEAWSAVKDTMVSHGVSASNAKSLMNGLASGTAGFLGMRLNEDKPQGTKPEKTSNFGSGFGSGFGN